MNPNRSSLLPGRPHGQFIRPPRSRRRLLPPDVQPAPLIALVGAGAWLNLPANRILALIDEGHLEGWDIGTGARRAIRVLTRSIERHLRTRGSRRRNWTFDEAAALILPGEAPVVTGPELQRALNCSANHVTRLLELHWLTPLPGSVRHPGPHGSPRLTRDSVLRFLRRRRLGGFYETNNPGRQLIRPAASENPDP